MDSYQQDFIDDLDSEAILKTPINEANSFDAFYRKQIAAKIDSSEYGKRRIKKMNREITQIKKIYNGEMAKTKNAEKRVMKLH